MASSVEIASRVRRLVRAVGYAYRQGRLGGKEMRAIHKVIDDAVAEIESIVKG